ncbi:MAG: SDR family oxidoreductase [Acidimicrobiaceae bacterium]
MEKRLEQKSTFVVGGNSGIGFAIAAAFATEGAHVTIAGTNPEKNERAVAELAQLNGLGNVGSIQLDVSDRDACFQAVEIMVQHSGSIDVLVNGAGVYTSRKFEDFTHDEFTRILDVNLHGPFHLTQAALPHMTAQKWGRVINIGSSAGKWASRNQSAYNVSKHGLIGMTRCVAVEVAGTGVTVNALCPGMVETDMSDSLEREQAEASGTTPGAVKAGLHSRIAMGRYLQPNEMAGLAVYLASDESSGMTGQSIMVDGGMVFV